MTISYFYFWGFRLFLLFILSVLLIIFFSAIRQRNFSVKDKAFYFLGLVCLAAYYTMWFLGQASPFYCQLDLSLLFNLMLILGVFLIYREVKILFK
ncbi:MAG: hypothetical protein PHR36_02055 [Patescibacteria group bacterium]|nr:hypothetical protein [Patescibacteria group bacterium]